MKNRFIIFCFVSFIFTVMSSCVGKKLSNHSWLEAFDQMHEELVLNYPFTEHKKIPWDSLYQITSQKIRQAETKQDKTEYYLAFRDYAFSIPDHHVCLAGNDFGLREQNIEAGYGFGIVRLEDSSYRVHLLLPGHVAETAGIKWGAEITHWNDIEIDQAVRSTSIRWAERPQATSEAKFLE